MAEFKMPSLGADMEAGTLLEWKVSPGDAVKRGDIIAVVDTQKAAIEVESFQTGIVEKLVIDEGTRVPVGTTLAVIRAEGEPAGQPAAPSPPSPAAEATPPPAAEASGATPSTPARPAPAARARISPAARRRARELGVDPAQITGSGERGAVTLADVERAAAAPAAETPAAKPAPPTGDRKAEVVRAMAAAMAKSKREIPHYYLSTTIDLEPALAFLTAENASRPIERRILPGVLLLKATALALRAIPELNGFFEDGTLRRAEAVHLGTAVSLRGGGIVAPTIHHADELSLEDLMQRLSDVAARARAGRLRSSELSDSTATVTSLGDRGSEAVYGVIYPPQVALVGFGRIAERPWVYAGQLVARPLVVATLSADHRASDGHRGAAFLRVLEDKLQEPESL
jgi:pyruvate dehydrogenase E2 component (dihydrolipoamide acetyltransferase)